MMRERGRRGGIRSGQTRRLRAGAPGGGEMSEDTKARLEVLEPKALQVLENVIERELDPKIDRSKKNPKIAYDAAMAILSYKWGKPGQELTLKNGGPEILVLDHPAATGEGLEVVEGGRGELTAGDGDSAA